MRRMGGVPFRLLRTVPFDEVFAWKAMRF